MPPENLNLPKSEGSCTVAPTDWQSRLTATIETPTRAGREGDHQPMPVASDSPSMHDLVIADIAKRREIGISRYGQPLQAHNGRDALWDLYEELLDGAAYIRQLIFERDNPASS